MVWVRVEPVPGTGLYQVAEAEPLTATHVAIAAFRQLETEMQAERDRNQRLYEKLQKQIRNKRNWRERALRAAGVGATRMQEKHEIRRLDKTFYEIRTLDLDAEAGDAALAEALKYAEAYSKSAGLTARVGRLYRRGPAWQAEIWIEIQPDYEAVRDQTED